MAIEYSKCGVPTSVYITDNLNNSIEIGAMLGTDGLNNEATNIEVFLTYDGSTPSSSNYAYKVISNSAYYGSNYIRAYYTLSFAELSQPAAKAIFGDSGVCTIKAIARTIGKAGADYYSNFTATKSGTFSWHALPTKPEIINPKAAGETTGTLEYTIAWKPSTVDMNNNITGYSVRLWNDTNKTTVSSGTTTNLQYTFSSGLMSLGNKYCFYVKPLCTYEVGDAEAHSGYLSIVPLGKFSSSNFNIIISD
jgi:hypothetical protein